MSASIDFDGPWKAALEELLEPCFGLLFTAAHQAIDWSVPPRFLDTVLQQIAPGGGNSPRTVDKLVEVRQRSGLPSWVLVHIEVQSQEQREFEARMFDYHARIWLQYQRQQTQPPGMRGRTFRLPTGSPRSAKDIFKPFCLTQKS